MQLDDSETTDEESVIELKPFFNWVGSKRAYAARLAALVPDRFDGTKHTYFEPFLGSGCLLLHLQPHNAVISDIDANVVFAFQQVKSDCDTVTSNLQKVYKSRDLRKKYEDLCHNFENLPDSEKTAAFIFISKHSFGSNMIYNKERTGFTLCFRGHRVNSDYVNMKAVSDYMRHAKITILKQTFQKVLEKAKKGDFVFMDPPYLKARKTDKRYYENDLTADDLIPVLKTLHSRNVNVLLINTKSKDLMQIPGYRCRPFAANEKILGVHRTSYRGMRKEYIYFNYEIAKTK